MKTVDVEGAPEGWPPKGSGNQGKPTLPNPMVLVAGLVFGLLVIIGAGMAATGNLGVVNVTDQEVATKVNYITGSTEVITSPGYQIYIPFVMDVFPMDRSPQKFMMEGKKIMHDNHVPLLTVRANDGSNFHFETLEIQYSIVPSACETILNDSGPDNGFKYSWVKAHARSVLRDEFGKYSAEEVANPATYRAARVASTERLNELLRPHGIEIMQIVTPKPKFDEAYEEAIEDRKVADQDVERLIAYKEQLLQEREQALAELEKNKEIERQTLEGDLARQLKGVEQEAIQIRMTADAYALGRLAEGEAVKARKVNDADGLEEQYRREAEGLVAKAKALEERGEIIVREALVKKLAEISFTFLPYSRDATPKRLEHIDRTSDGARLDEAMINGGR
jgi:membrane protease subunit HflC